MSKLTKEELLYLGKILEEKLNKLDKDYSEVTCRFRHLLAKHPKELNKINKEYCDKLNIIDSIIDKLDKADE